MKRLFKRLFYGLIFALPIMVLTYALAHADSQNPSDQPTNYNCAGCHNVFVKSWERGAHGQSTTDPAFRESWENQGKPAECMECHVTGYNADTGEWKSDGVTCEACHGEPNPNHPEEPMAAERSAKLCGECHNETFFEWQASEHRAEGLDCAGCHDPHATQLKNKDEGDLCSSCHRERASNFAHSEHSKQGMDCVDCHLAKLEGEGEGHARLDHSFRVQLSTCNSCHVYQMHDPSQVHPESPTPMPLDSLASVETLSVASEPTPVNPLGFSGLSGLIGLAVGIILAPYIERWNRRK